MLVNHTWTTSIMALASGAQRTRAVSYPVRSTYRNGIENPATLG